MTPALVCNCGTELPMEGEETSCPDCGASYNLSGLGPARASRPTKETETDVQGRIVEALQDMGFHVSTLDQGYRADGSTRQTKGIPDLWAMHPRMELALWIEVKGPKTPVRRSQRTWHTIARTSGVHVTVARSVADVVSYLGEIGAEIEAA